LTDNRLDLTDYSWCIPWHTHKLRLGQPWSFENQ
jgi:hypothetical protein